MTLTKKQLDRTIHGAVQSKEADGLYAYIRVTDEQLAYYEREPIYFTRANHTAGIRMELRTDASELSFDYKIDHIVSEGCLDVCINGVVYEVYPFAGRHEGRFFCILPAGMKTVSVYFPTYCRMLISNVSLNSDFRSVSHHTKVLFLGDSITQGASVQTEGTMMASGSYVNLTSRAMGWEMLDHAIGGLLYDGGSVIRPEGYTPDKLIVSLGTNGCGAPDFMKRAEGFYEALDRVYGGIPTLVITPIWRGDAQECEKILADNTGVRALCARYPNIRIVDGFTLMPNISGMLQPDKVHPNLLGHKYYSDNLIRAMRTLKF